MTEGYGEIRRDGDNIAVRFDREYDVPAARVWSALTDPDRLGRWLGPVRSGTIGAGGVFELTMNDDPVEIARCTVREFTPGRCLEFDWDYTGERASQVRFELIPTATGTRLVLEHRRLTADERGYGAGWHAHLDRFGDLVAGRDLASWDERFVAVLPAYRRQLDELALP